MKKKEIIASLTEELEMMRQRAESAERELFGEPVWVDADGEEIDFTGKYCLASDLDCKGVTFPAGTDACLRVLNSTPRRKVIVVEAGNSYPCPSLLGDDTFKPVIGWLRLDFNLPPSGDNWRDQRLAVPVRKVKAEKIKED
jgi:hypothetical protein